LRDPKPTPRRGPGFWGSNSNRLPPGPTVPEFFPALNLSRTMSPNQHYGLIWRLERRKSPRIEHRNGATVWFLRAGAGIPTNSKSLPGARRWIGRESPEVPNNESGPVPVIEGFFRFTRRRDSACPKFPVLDLRKHSGRTVHPDNQTQRFWQQSEGASKPLACLTASADFFQFPWNRAIRTAVVNEESWFFLQAILKNAGPAWPVGYAAFSVCHWRLFAISGKSPGFAAQFRKSPVPPPCPSGVFEKCGVFCVKVQWGVFGSETRPRPFRSHISRKPTGFLRTRKPDPLFPLYGKARLAPPPFSHWFSGPPRLEPKLPKENSNVPPRPKICPGLLLELAGECPNNFPHGLVAHAVKSADQPLPPPRPDSRKYPSRAEGCRTPVWGPRT